MDLVYRSKVDRSIAWGLWMPATFCLGGVVFFLCKKTVFSLDYLFLAANIVGILLLMCFLMINKYVISHDALLIQLGFFRMKIPLKDITLVKPLR